MKHTTKLLSSKAWNAIKAGGNNMFKQSGTCTQKPGVTSQEHSRTLKSGPARGGSTKMFGKMGADPQKPA